MNKCFNCGVEFEGKFCPECGAKYEETKTCPQCGTELDGQAKFCNECGYSFVQQDTKQPKSVTTQASQTVKVSYEFDSKFYQKLHKILTSLPVVFFALFAVLNWVFMAYNVASLQVPWGNVYTMTADYDFHSYAVALIVFAALSCVSVIICAALQNSFSNKRRNFVQFLIYAIYFCVFLISVTLNVAVKKERLQVESATKLLIAFTVIFATFSVFSVVAKKSLSKRNEKYAKAVVEQASQPTFMQKIAHSSYYKSHARKLRAITGFGIAVALVLVLVLGVIVPITTSEFYVNRLAKINIGDTQEQVEQLLGKADKKSSYTWTYYGKYWQNYQNKVREFDEWVENIEDFDQFFGAFVISEKFDEKEKQITDKQLTISFDRDGNVSSLSMDKNYNIENNEQKEVKKITLGTQNTVDINDLINETVAVRTYFVDGSFQLSTLPSNASSSNLKTNASSYSSTIFPVSGSIEWTDSNGEHSQQVNFSEIGFNFTWKYSNNTLELDGTIPTAKINDFFQMEGYPWIDEDISVIRFGSNVTDIPNISGLVKDENLLETIIVNDNNPNYSASNGILFNKDKSAMIYWPHLNTNFPGADWWNSQPDGLIYNGSALCGYKGVMPANYQLQVRDGTTIIFAETFKGQSNLIRVVLPDSLQIIGDSAFYDCSSLTSITIPSSVTSIGYSAFNNCGSLTSITIPSTVTNINMGTFAGCNKLESITIPFVGATNGGTSNTHFGYIFGASSSFDNSSYVPSSLKQVIITGGNSIGSYAFRGCSSLTSIIIPSSVTSIGDDSFSGCSNLQTVTFEGNSQLTSIGRFAFDGCSSLESITIPSSVTSIGSSAFLGCRSLESIAIPSRVMNVGVSTFEGCNSLESIIIPSSVTSIGDDSFSGCSNLQTVTFEGNSQLTSIGSFAFCNCSSLTSIIIPSSVTSIGSSAFFGCSNLESIAIPSRVMNVGARTFEGCNSLESIIIPSSVTSIGEFAFYDCSNLQTVTFESNSQLTSIGSDAFYNCSSLGSITIPSRVTSIGGSAFEDCSNLQTVTFEGNSQLTSIGRYAFDGCSSLNAVYISSLTAWCNTDFVDSTSNPLHYAKNLYLNNKLVTELEISSEVTSINSNAFYNCSSLTSITIPSSVTSIGESAFSGCSNLQTVTFEGNSQLTSIGIFAFSGCSSLTSITIPSSVTSIGYYAFNYCSNLQTVTFESNSQLTSIGLEVFYNCSSLTSITIPSSVTSIDNYAFRNCSSLTSITIPLSVTSIGYYAFEGCNSLTSVIFENPNGWRLQTGTSLYSSDLSNPATAAQYLRSTYSYYSWNRT